MKIIPEKKEVYDRIKESMYTDEGELEVLVNKQTGISRNTFIRLLEYCRRNNYHERNVPEMLDIRTLFKTQSDKSILSNTRASILNKVNIKKYCETDDLNLVEKFNIAEDSSASNINYIQKSNYFKKGADGERAFFNSVINDEYNYKINLKREVKSNEYNLSNFKESWEDKLKMFRYKKRFSFITRDTLFRIDLTIVKESKKENNGQYILTKTFRESNTLLNPEIYELEIEYMGSLPHNNERIPAINKYIDLIVGKEDIKLENILQLATYNNLYRLPSKLESVEFSSIYSVKDELRKSSRKIIQRKLTPVQEKDLVLLIIEVLNYHLFNLLKIVNNSSILLSNAKKTNIINQYKNLTKDQQEEHRIVMATPQPVTLTLEYLSAKETPSILINYSVTEKADGDRFLLYVDNLGDAYLINLTGVTKYNTKTYMNIIPMVIKFKKLKNVIVDGEYVTKTVDGKPTNQFLYFDVYLYPGTKGNVFNMPFYSEDTSNKTNRCHFMREFNKEYNENSDFTEDSISIKMKDYYHGGGKMSRNILKHSDKILKRAKNKEYPYNIDGLIFIPSNLSVKATSIGEKVKKINGTWPLNFKWKPPEENTIDFLVETRIDDKKNKDKIIYSVDEETNTIKKYKQYYLKVGYNENDDFKTEFYLKTLRGDKKPRNKSSIYFNPSDEVTKDGKIKSDLHITNVELKSGRAFCENDKSEFKTGDIVEFRYVEDAENNAKWVPLRKRPDKQFPQYYKIAYQIWDTICKPVSKKTISGNESADNMDAYVEEYKNDKPEFSHDNLYYVGKDRTTSISRPLLDFHNFVKYSLISGIAYSIPGKLNLLDTSCGRGGDLNKWLSIKDRGRSEKFKFILGLDISRDIGEAAKRLYNSKDYNMGKLKTDIVFAMSDTGKHILSGDSLNIDGMDKSAKEMIYSRNIMNILYGRNLNDIPESYSDLKMKFNNKARTEKFDIISSQFSIHYYFKNKDTLLTYIQNISDNIKIGGYFIGTCYDGLAVYDTLNNDENAGVLEYKDDNDDLVYSIKRDYDSIYNDFVWEEDSDLKDIDKYLGVKIKVFMETIGQEITEYLVNFDLFLDIMEQYGFELDSPMDTRTVFTNIGKGSFGKVYEKFLISKFVDRNGRAKDMGDNAELSELSFLNNWFVFKKIR